MKSNAKLLVISSVFGTAALLSAVMGLYAEFGSWLDGPNDSAWAVTYWTGKAGVIICEALFSVVFVLVSLVLLWVTERTEQTRTILISAGLFRILLSLIFFISFYRTGWYFILDPVGHTKFAFLVLIFGALQGILLLFARRQ